MKWVPHFGDRNKIEIYDAAHGINSKTSNLKAKANPLSQRELQLLKRLDNSFDRETDRCSWRLDSVPKEILQYLHGIEPGKPDNQPFGSTIQQHSRLGYQSVGHRYLEFCWRAHELGREAAAARLAIRFTDEQWSLMDGIAQGLEDEQLGEINSQSTVQHDSGFFSEEETTHIDTEEDGEEEQCRERRRELAVIETSALDQAVFKFIVASIKVRVGGDMYNNSFCAATAIRIHPLGYTEAYLYTGVLAALLWLARLFFLEASFEDVSRQVDQVDLDAIARFQREHETWMCIGTYTAMSKIIN